MHMDDFLDLLTPVLIVWGVFAVSFLYNRSRLRNCLYLAVALLATVGFVTSLASESGYLPGLVVIFLALLFVLVVPFFLIGNGVIMLRREGRNLANLLSFLVGVIVLLGEAACVYVVLGTVQGTIMPTAMHRLVALFGMSVFYFCCVFLMFITYSKFIEHVPHRRDFDYLIVHGAGLLPATRCRNCSPTGLTRPSRCIHATPRRPSSSPAEVGAPTRPSPRRTPWRSI